MLTLSVYAHAVSFKQVEVDTKKFFVNTFEKFSLDALPYGGSFCTLYLSGYPINKSNMG
jgi:hypothetical protein